MEREENLNNSDGLICKDGKFYYGGVEISQEEAEQINREQALSFENLLDIPGKIAEKIKNLLPSIKGNIIESLILKHRISKAKNNLINYAFEPVGQGETRGILWDIWCTLSYCRKNGELNANIDITRTDNGYTLLIKGSSKREYQLTEEEFEMLSNLY
ncbi:hypothetical protein LAT59_00405 [Candidatus Gracilibacteria bacterium]|nr:hypothetical protein [Candidatus Gracilibacteria bacterium]